MCRSFNWWAAVWRVSQHWVKRGGGECLRGGDGVMDYTDICFIHSSVPSPQQRAWPPKYAAQSPWEVLLHVSEMLTMQNPANFGMLFILFASTLLSLPQKREGGQGRESFSVLKDDVKRNFKLRVRTDLSIALE